MSFVSNKALTPEQTVIELREQLKIANKRADSYQELYRHLAQILTRANGGVEPSMSQVRNMANKYLVMGQHFEILMTAINRHETLVMKWEDLMILLKLTEGHDEDD